MEDCLLSPDQGVTKKCRLSWLTNSALVGEPKCGRGGRGFLVSANGYSCAHVAQTNFGDLAPYLTYGPVHRVHKVATAAFWRTFSDEGKIGARPSPLITFTITSKVAVYRYAPAEWADTLTLFHL
jgi:hypothetical protein